MTPEPDYPAAHSMDTTWFAVDRDGHVGVFESGEAGAMPDGALTSEEVPLDDLAKALPVAPFRLLDWIGEDGEEQHRELPDRRSEERMGSTLLFLNNVDLIAQEIEKWDAETAPASEGVAVLFYNLPVETAWRLHEVGACFGCFAWDSEGGYRPLSDELPHLMGLFKFDHETENWIAGGYKREEPPFRLLKVEEFPPDLRAAVARFRFENVSFAEADKIQPVDHAPCQAWGDAYLDLDGRTVRPIPGREEGFNAEDWSWNPELRVERPPQPPPG